MQEKVEMEKLISEMEQKVMKGGEQLAEQEREANRAYWAVQLKKKKLKQKEKEMMIEQKKREEEKLMMEEEYKSKEEEVEMKTKKIGKLRWRYKQALQEIEDLEHEHQQQKVEMLETIRF